MAHSEGQSKDENPRLPSPLYSMSKIRGRGEKWILNLVAICVYMLCIYICMTLEGVKRN